MEKGRDEDNTEAREEERLANLKARNSEDFARFGSFRFAYAKEISGGKASQQQTKRKKSTVEKPTVEVTRVLRSQTTRDVDNMPSDNIEEHEGHEGKKMEKGRDEDNAEAREEERLANLKARNSEDFARFGSFRFAYAKEISGGKSSQQQTKRKKSTVEKPTVEVTRVLRSQTTRDVDNMPSDNIEEHEGHEGM
ncbi:hypothetical protein ZWY2020_015590 [Hordeum vulgare]|nr:hypothetical protein ZWY2020_015590 [Hordeum vulgare]